MKKHHCCSFIQSCGGSGKKEWELPTKKCLQRPVLPQSVVAGCLNFFDSDSFRLADSHALFTAAALFLADFPHALFLLFAQSHENFVENRAAAAFAAAAYYAPTAAKLPIFKTLSTVFSGFYFFRPEKFNLSIVSHRNRTNIFQAALLCPAERPAAA
ncbi:MAG: hypothetical protein ACTFAL_02170 [Candidatus Electronema sp. V4]|uniref:hypothetical protein n=1 Tax=Candidatus Electronema sp. V4 TaxID=3454756 RepID=UPI0040559C19